jgi:hypothetical protein
VHEEVWKSGETEAARCCDSSVSIDNSGDVSFVVGEDILEIEIGVPGDKRPLLFSRRLAGEGRA